MTSRTAPLSTLALPAAVGPWSGFALAAEAAVHDLHRRLGLDLWLVTHVDGDRLVVVAAAGPWRAAAQPGRTFCWSASFCLEMVRGGGPVLVPDVQASPRFAAAAVGEGAHVRAYVGVPLLSTEGRLFGALCAFAGQPQPCSLTDVLEPASLLGRMLSTILAGEQAAADRSSDAAAAYALAERDPLTGLRNGRGWAAALAAEEQRSRRYGSPVSVLSVRLDRLRRVDEVAGPAADDSALTSCAAVLREGLRPGDAAGRASGGRFGVLAVECDAVCARALERRLRVRLRSVGVAAAVGSATRRPHEDLQHTWERAGCAAEHDERRRQLRSDGAAGVVHPRDRPPLRPRR